MLTTLEVLNVTEFMRIDLLLTYLYGRAHENSLYSQDCFWQSFLWFVISAVWDVSCHAMIDRCSYRPVILCWRFPLTKYTKLYRILSLRKQATVFGSANHIDWNQAWISRITYNSNCLAKCWQKKTQNINLPFEEWIESHYTGILCEQNGVMMFRCWQSVIRLTGAFWDM